MDHSISSFKRYLPNIIYDEKAVDHVLKRNYEKKCTHRMADAANARAPSVEIRGVWGT